MPFKKPRPRKSGKAGATDIPSWAQGLRPLQGESGEDFARRVTRDHHGHEDYPKGPGSEYSKLKKYGDRHFV